MSEKEMLPDLSRGRHSIACYRGCHSECSAAHCFCVCHDTSKDARIADLEAQITALTQERDAYRETILHGLVASLKLVADAAVVAHKEYSVEQVHRWTISNIEAAERTITDLRTERDRYKAALEEIVVSEEKPFKLPSTHSYISQEQKLQAAFNGNSGKRNPADIARAALNPPQDGAQP